MSEKMFKNGTKRQKKKRIEEESFKTKKMWAQKKIL